MYLMHWGFRRDLAGFTATVPVTPVGDRRAWRRLSRRFALFAAVLHKHHTGEDAACGRCWPDEAPIAAPWTPWRPSTRSSTHCWPTSAPG